MTTRNGWLSVWGWRNCGGTRPHPSPTNRRPNFTLAPIPVGSPWNGSSPTALTSGRRTDLVSVDTQYVLHRERIINDRDNRRNRYVFVLTAVTLIQSVLIWYDFLTNDNAAVGADPRPSIAVVVLVLTVISLVGALFWGPVVERRQRRRRRAGAG